jgi:Cys-tRNA(Pro)/Cys-tRNA(Cys) deacylase
MRNINDYKKVGYPKELRDTTLVAKYLKIPEGQLFKSLLLLANAKLPILVMIPSNTQLDLKTLANLLKYKKVVMPDRNEVLEITGMQVGGVSPLGLLGKKIPIYIDYKINLLSNVTISAGNRGETLTIPVADLLTITKAKVLNLMLESKLLNVKANA